jgi:hypothetical protein
MDIVERLKKHDCKTLLDAYDVMEDAADEIERLRDEIAACTEDVDREVKLGSKFEASYLDCVEKHNLTLDDLAAAEAREAKLREALEWCSRGMPDYQPARQALAMPADDSALKEALKQAKREALLEAAERMGDDVPAQRWAAREIRSMAASI